MFTQRHSTVSVYAHLISNAHQYSREIAVVHRELTRIHLVFGILYQYISSMELLIFISIIEFCMFMMPIFFYEHMKLQSLD